MVKELTIFIRLKVNLSFELYFIYYMHALTKKHQILMHQLSTTSIWMKMRLMIMNLVEMNLMMMRRKKKSIIHHSLQSSNLSEESEQQHLKSSGNDDVVVGRKHTEVVNTAKDSFYDVKLLQRSRREKISAFICCLK